MEQIIQRCAGLDIHRAVVVATVRVPDGDGGRRIHTIFGGNATDAVRRQSGETCRVAATGPFLAPWEGAIQYRRQA
jgi:hypothetical protein